MNVHIDKLSAEIVKELNAYNTELENKVNEAIKETAQSVCKGLKSNINIPKKSGDYRKSFYVKKLSDNKYIIANKVYRLTHLLEKGHVTRSGTRTNAYPHWKQAQDEANEVITEIRRKLGG